MSIHLVDGKITVNTGGFQSTHSIGVGYTPKVVFRAKGYSERMPLEIGEVYQIIRLYHAGKQIVYGTTYFPRPGGRR